MTPSCDVCRANGDLALALARCDGETLEACKACLALIEARKAHQRAWPQTAPERP